MTLELWNGYTLQMKGADDESSTKFAKLFCSTWDSLPAGFRQIVTLYWNTSGDSPTFCFEPFVFESGRIVSGRVKDRGHTIEYNSEICALINDHLMKVVIVHELSHIAFLALNQNDHVALLDFDYFSKSDEEKYKIKLGTELLAFEMTRRLGYPQDEFSEWLNCTLSDSNYSERDNDDEISARRKQYIQKWTEMEVRWAKTYSPDSRTLPDAKDHFYMEHDGFFSIAIYEDIMSSNLSSLESARKFAKEKYDNHGHPPTDINNG